MNIKTYIPNYVPLTDEQLAEIKGMREIMLSKFRNTPKEGVEVNYLDQKFIVYPNTFYPHEDSKPLVNNFVVNKGDLVLDVGTGSGVIAIFAALKGAQKVVAVDISPDALITAKENAKRHGLENVIELRQSDGPTGLKSNEQFDVITANFPFTEDTAVDVVAHATYDPSFRTYENFFKSVDTHLSKKGRIYLSQANFGNVEKMITLAEEQGFNVKLIGTNELPTDLRIFYAFELTK